MITLIGTGHVFNLTQQLLDIFDEIRPEIICVELDKQRYDAKYLNKQIHRSIKTNQKIFL